MADLPWDVELSCGLLDVADKGNRSVTKYGFWRRERLTVCDQATSSRGISCHDAKSDAASSIPSPVFVTAASIISLHAAGSGSIRLGVPTP
ncbi:hypothetical protein RRG08_026107 [Elysia crispata]|uniref:Uncharacterized protein n=1 Tax=Elysia crispata TaxID=231223 RepID=A0AAE1D344_9GAST|nr:hypothetical protein RRG08_026107 [Elysia crispata]